MSALARFAVVSLLALQLGGCAHTTRPRSLADADATRRSPATADARDAAPQAVLEADGFLAEAEREQRAGHVAAANVLAERASVAYERAFVQARIVRSTLALESAKKAQAAAEAENAKKASAIYATVDRYPDFYRAPVKREDRSEMNVVFRLPDEALEERFVKEANAARLIGLKGHRSVGGIRVSLYNAVSSASADVLADFMKDFVTRG